MPKIVFNTAEGEVIAVDAAVGETVMLAATLGDVPGIEAECGGGCSCGTCHIRIRPDWQGVVGGANDLEAGMLDALDGVEANSRLSCQIDVTEALDGLEVDVVES